VVELAGNIETFPDRSYQFEELPKTEVFRYLFVSSANAYKELNPLKVRAERK
jgi:hypothetical protein